MLNPPPPPLGIHHPPLNLQNLQTRRARHPRTGAFRGHYGSHWAIRFHRKGNVSFPFPLCCIHAFYAHALPIKGDKAWEGSCTKMGKGLHGLAQERERMADIMYLLYVRKPANDNLCPPRKRIETLIKTNQTKSEEKKMEVKPAPKTLTYPFRNNELISIHCLPTIGLQTTIRNAATTTSIRLANS